MTAVPRPAPPEAPSSGRPQAAGPPAPPTAPSTAGVVADTVLHAYSQVLFSSSRPVGALLLAATFVVPEVGLVGLLGVVLASALAWVLHLDRAALREGVLGYNALLVFLAIGAMADHGLAFWSLAAVTAGLVVVVHVALSGVFSWYLRLPVLSVPFVLVTWTVMAAAPHLRGLAFHGHPPALDVGAFPGPAALDGFLRSLGAIFFQPHWTAGALVLAALLLHTRIGTLHAVIGYAVARAAGAWWFTFPADQVHLYAGFNFVVTAVALGGVFYVPGASATLLAIVGAVATGLVTAAFTTALQPVGLPVLAAPFNLVLLLALYALGQRTRDVHPRTVDFVAGSPEANLAWWRTRVRRFHASLPLRLQLPVRGTWSCTQGHDGAHTHQGAWRHGLDFEVRDAEGRPGRTDRLEDCYSHRLPVLAVAPGTVVRVVDGQPDEPVGHQDTERSWGNAVVVQHAPDLFSVVAHLSPGTIPVVEGQSVVAGQRLGLCGSSGRAPLPHVHVQLQRTPVVGDATVAIAFHDVLREDDDGLELLREHVPEEGERLRNPTVDPAVAEALRWPVGRRATVSVRRDGVETRETLVSETDLLGRRWLRSEERGSRLSFDDRGTAFVALDYEGRGGDALEACYLALLRVPYDDARRLRWTDTYEPAMLRRGPVAWLAEAASAFVAPRARAIAFTKRHDRALRRVVGEARADRGHPAIATEAVFEPGVGWRSVRVTRGDHETAVAWIAG